MKLFFKKSICYIFLLFYVINYAQESSSFVIYKKKANTNIVGTNSNHQKRTAAKLLIENAIKNLDNLEYKLLYNNELSSFSEIESLEIDNGNNSISTILSKSFGDTEGVFYSNIKEQNLLIEKELDGRIFLVKTKFSDFKWDVTSDQKKIGNYNCYKAVRTYTRVTVSGEKQMPVIAWFAPEIPYSFGPASYLGLPGLVLEVEVDNIVIYASKIFLNQKEKQVITIPKKGKIISEKEYNEFEKNGFDQFKSFN